MQVLVKFISFGCEKESRKLKHVMLYAAILKISEDTEDFGYA